MRPSKYIELDQNRKDVHRVGQTKRTGSEQRRAVRSEGWAGMAAFQEPQADNETCRLASALLLSGWTELSQLQSPADGIK